VCRSHLDVDLGAHDVQLLAGFHLKEVQEVGHRGQQDAAADADGLRQVPLLLLQGSRRASGRVALDNVYGERMLDMTQESPATGQPCWHSPVAGTAATQPRLWVALINPSSQHAVSTMHGHHKGGPCAVLAMTHTCRSVSSSISADARQPLSGVRTSWHMRLMNSDLASLAAFSRATTRAR